MSSAKTRPPWLSRLVVAFFAAGCGGQTASSVATVVYDAGTTGDATTPHEAGADGEAGASTEAAPPQEAGNSPDGCVAGAACTPPGNPCRTGALACGTGQTTCEKTGDQPDGTTCAAGICCAGLCAACSTPPNAWAVCSGATCGFACNAGRTACGGSCVDTTSDAKACGPTCAVCPKGSSCKASQCAAVFVVGNSTAYSPCDTSKSNQIFPSNYLIGERIYLSTSFQVTALGVITTSAQPAGVDIIMALYDDVGGLPSALQARTPTTTIGPGDNLIPVVAPAPVTAGKSYWIMGEYSATASICVDTSVSNPVTLVAIGGFGVVPATLSNQLSESSVDFNYYIVGSQ